MNAPLQALREMKRLTTPFPPGPVVDQWKTEGGRVVGFVGLAVPEEIIHAARMLPIRISADNVTVPLQEADACMPVNTSASARALLQMALDGRYGFLDGVVVSVVNQGTRRLLDNWRSYAPRPYMDSIFLPRKRTEEACALYLADLEDWRSRLSELRGAYILERDLKRAIAVYNRGRELMQRLYALRERERPPVTGAETLEIIKAATRMPRERFNDLLESLLAEVERTGRGIAKGRRLMIIGSDLQDSTWIESVEDLDAVVVTDHLCTGARYCFGAVDTSLSPMEALARYYLQVRPPGARAWPATDRFMHILAMARQFRVDGVISRTERHDADCVHGRTSLRKEMRDHGIPFLELDVEQGDGRSDELAARCGAFIDELKGRAAAPVTRARAGGHCDRSRTGSSPRATTR
jgi:benzoyl-CoA reductase/2-hydroxyglutaryl-CoA dehydratase subunit BcrC/BadD/HgdB